MFFPKVIAVTGLKGSGKNTVANHIIDLYEETHQIKTVAFADPIRKQIEHIFSLNGSDKQYDSFKRSTMLFNVGYPGSQSIYSRRAVREIGMLMRSYDEGQFVTYVHNKIISEKDKVWIITDLRFENELDYLMSINAFIIKVARDVPQDDHITEAGIDDKFCNVILNNNGTEDELRLQIKNEFDKYI
jgi:hypothetical protein